MSSSTFCFLIVAALIAQIVVALPIGDKTVQKRHCCATVVQPAYAPVYAAPVYHYVPSAPVSSSSFVSGGGGAGGGGIQSVIGGEYGLSGSSFVAGGGGSGGGIQSVIGGGSSFVAGGGGHAGYGYGHSGYGYGGYGYGK